MGICPVQMEVCMECWVCGKKAKHTALKMVNRSMVEVTPSPYIRCYCDACAKEVAETEKREREQYIKLKKKEMVRHALSLLEEQGTNMYEYRPAIKVVEEFLEENPDKVDSSYEAVTAIVLVHNHIQAHMQYKIGKYQADFVLPELRIVLEVDGERHKNRAQHDRKRDSYIRATMGKYWEIIHIPTEYIDKDVKKIPEAIEKVLEYRKTLNIDWRQLYL